jgi:hypothetical protein
MTANTTNANDKQLWTCNAGGIPLLYYICVTSTLVGKYIDKGTDRVGLCPTVLGGPQNQRSLS